jgi:hypothetical protein
MTKKDVLKEDLASDRLYMGMFFTTIVAAGFIYFQRFEDLNPLILYSLFGIMVVVTIFWIMIVIGYRRKMKDLFEMD